MKLIGTLGVMLVGAMIVGCNTGGPPAQVSLASTTTLSSATQPKPVRDPNPRFLTTPAEQPAPKPTWGGAQAPDPSEASDLAANPYLTTPETAPARDLYDPR